MKKEIDPDIEFLIKQLYTIEHMQDAKKIEEIARKYNLYPY